VTKRTKLLIVGELGWPLLDDGRPSNKLSRATAYGVPIVSERRFLEWIGKAIPNELQKTYSADQLASLSKLSSEKYKNSRTLVCWISALNASAFATWQALGKSRSCLRRDYYYHLTWRRGVGGWVPPGRAVAHPLSNAAIFVGTVRQKLVITEWHHP
jgi:hypothetical protein